MTTAFKRKLFYYRQEIELLDGRRIFLRPIGPQDKQALTAFHSRLSPDTRFLRYQYCKGDLTEQDLKNFCDVDYDRNLALVAETGSDGSREIIGVGRFCRLSDPQTAEVAFVVEDREQRKGVGTQLLKHLAIIAHSKGIRYFVAEVLRTNGKMLSVFRKSDSRMEQVTDDSSTCTVTLSVAEIINRSPR
jgi:GNAT superfamily N-acetyltransferase